MNQRRLNAPDSQFAKGIRAVLVAPTYVLLDDESAGASLRAFIGVRGVAVASDEVDLLAAACDFLSLPVEHRDPVGILVCGVSGGPDWSHSGSVIDLQPDAGAFGDQCSLDRPSKGATGLG